MTPEHAGQAHVDGEGHTHLYIDGRKVARLYAPRGHLTELEPGPHEIKETLHTNKHEAYRVNGEGIGDRLVVGAKS